MRTLMHSVGLICLLVGVAVSFVSSLLDPDLDLLLATMLFVSLAAYLAFQLLWPPDPEEGSH